MRARLDSARTRSDSVHNLFTSRSPAGNRRAARADQPLAAMELSRETEVIRAGDLEVRPGDHIALASGRALSLSVRELELLAALARRQGRIVAREELYASVWGAPLREQDRSVDVYVHKLRSKLARAIPGCQFIHTHFGFGYRFEPEHSAGFVGEHRLSHPFHKGDNDHEQDGFR
jgi:DNA-binding response OmpR family regulator